MSDDELAKKRGAQGKVTIICPKCHAPVPGYSQINGVVHHLTTRGVNNFEEGAVCPAQSVSYSRREP